MATTSDWLSLDEATTQLADAAVAVKESETVPLQQGLGRIIATDMIARMAVPPWDNAGMDGYAVAAEYVSDAAMPLQGVITAGTAHPPSLEPGKCLRIMTGAPLPEGADAVVMQENTSDCERGVQILQRPVNGENVRQKGNDVTPGDVLIAGGTMLSAAHLMVLASQGHDTVSVLRKVRIGVITTGDELTNPGSALTDGKIYDANRTGIIALLNVHPVEITDYGIVKDDPHALRAVFNAACQSQDIVISSGGVSVGDADFVKDVIAELGNVGFWKVAIKPGKPFAFGTLGNTLFCGVPGNPVSAYVTTQLLVLPLVSRLSGNRASPALTQFTATLATPIKRRAGRLEFMRAHYENTADKRLRVTPLARQSSAVMTSVSQANCYLVVGADTEVLQAGEQVEIVPFTPYGLM